MILSPLHFAGLLHVTCGPILLVVTTAKVIRDGLPYVSRQKKDSHLGATGPEGGPSTEGGHQIVMIPL